MKPLRNTAEDTRPGGLNLARSSSLVLLAYVSGSVMTILSSFLVARHLGPTVLGAMSVLVTVPTIMAALTTFGFHTAGVYYLGQRTFAVRDVVSTLVVVEIGVSALWILVALVAFHALHAILFKHIASPFVVAMLATLPAQLVGIHFGDIYLSLDRFLLFATARILPTAIYLGGLVILVLVAGMRLWGVVLSFAVGMDAAAVISLLSAYRLGWLSMTFNRSFFRVGLRFGLKTHTGEVAQYCNYRVDLLFVNYFSGLKAAGYYAIAVRIAELLFQVSRSMRLVLFTRVVRLNKMDTDRLTAFLLRNTLAVTLIVASCVAVAAAVALRVILPAYQPSAVLIYILLPGTCFASVFQLVTGDLNGRGKPDVSMYLMLGGLILGLAGYVLTIPRIGAVGAAATSAIAYTSESIAAALVLARLASVPLAELLVPRLADLRAVRTLTRRFPLMTRGGKHHDQSLASPTILDE